MKIKIALTGILIFACTLTQSKEPSVPVYYGRCGINPFYQLPFTKAEIKIFKEMKIKRIESSGKYLPNGEWKNIYYLNKKGQVISTDTYNFEEGKEDTLFGNTFFKYNSSGLLTIRNQTGYMGTHYDSLVYDESGRLIRFYSHSIDGIEQFKMITQNYKLLESTKEHVVLVDSSDGYIQKLWFNNQNQTFRFHRSNSIDSCSIENINKSEYVRRGWYNDYDSQNNSVFRLGAEEIYKDSLIQVRKNWSMRGDGKHIARSTFFYYDHKNRLLREETGAVTTFYTYFDTGLVTEVVHLYNGEATVVKYRYFYF